MAATTANTPETMIPEGGVANFAVLEFAIFFLMKGCWWAGVLGWMERRFTCKPFWQKESRNNSRTTPPIF